MPALGVDEHDALHGGHLEDGMCVTVQYFLVAGCEDGCALLNCVEDIPFLYTNLGANLYLEQTPPS